jgi:hypothetical protein
MAIRMLASSALKNFKHFRWKVLVPAKSVG